MPLYRFDDFALDPAARRLIRNGRDAAIEPRVLDLVAYLVEHRERAVGRDELIAAVWGRVDSSDSTLAQAILKARRLFGDDGSAQRTIRTVARFGYQWVAATTIDAESAARNAPIDATLRDAADAAASAIESASASPATTRSIPAESSIVATIAAEAVPTTTRSASRRILALAAVACSAIAAVVIGVALQRAATPDHTNRATTATSSAPVANLILVAPARVHSAIAEDGWMRLGIMAMSADALRALPNREVVANETTLAIAGHDDRGEDVVALRARSGAATVVTIDARRDEGRWTIEATLHHADGSRESVDAADDDGVAAAGALAERLRTAFAPEERTDTPSPERSALAARMQATILDGHADRALSLFDAAPAAIAAEPDIVLLRARALNRVGRAHDAADALDVLIARAGDTTPAWLAPAWSTRGYSALVEGAPQNAEQDFRRALAVGVNDRNEIGRAWRGLGNAQAARGAFDDAEASYLRARFELAESGDRLLVAHLLDDLGTVAGRRGRFDDAVARYREAADAAAALGATEVEIGARMNVALAEGERLHHRAALEAWRAVLPRVRALDYPSMRRYAAVHYADALAETGALRDAAAALDDRADASVRDALENTAVDRLRVRLAIGDARTAAVDARALDTVSAAPRALDALRLDAALAAGDDAAAQSIATKLGPAARDDAPVVGIALARAWRRRGDASQADRDATTALDAARTRGSPRDLRDAAVSLATSRLERGDVDAARTLAAMVEPYATDDFAITLLLARIDAVAGDAADARRRFGEAQALAGERWTSGLAAESAAGGARIAAAR
jgi:DNA-binding winged helix-turn-helix (wHTH) protein/tetratricopeptide (TPR) repeat protein